MTIPHQGFVIGDGKHPGYCTAEDHPADLPREFEGRAPGMDRCHSCWYGEALNDADAAYEPLFVELERLGISRDDLFVDQTGGMVMLGRVVVQRGETVECSYTLGGVERTYTTTPERYVWISDPRFDAEDDAPAYFGYYDDIAAIADENNLDDHDVEGESCLNEDIKFFDWPAFAEWIAGCVVAKRLELNVVA